MSSLIRVHVARPIATVQFQAPGRGAGVDYGEWLALGETFRTLSERPDVEVVVVRGGWVRFSGNPREATMLPAAGGSPAPFAMEVALAAVRGCPHPTVAVIEGVCVGADLEIVACCDLRVCGESGRLGAPIDHGDARGGLSELSRLLGSSPALRALQGGGMMTAEWARACGLVSHVHPDSTVVRHAYRLAASVAAGAPLVNRWHKSVVQRLGDRSMRTRA